jgi:NAD(P)-dependent dehydrogenase (short-subunit alcohol dehydrogenase family)
MGSYDHIETSFTASTNAEEVVRGIDLSGVRAIVTGSSSGIGVATARALASAGAELTIAVRDIAAGDTVADEIRGSTNAAGPRVSRLDLASRKSVADFVHAWDGPLHLLINNAGLVTSGLEPTVEGWELQFATNHLGHFALAIGLHDALARGAAERGGTRIVSLSSTAHMRSGIDFADLHFQRRTYDSQFVVRR